MIRNSSNCGWHTDLWRASNWSSIFILLTVFKFTYSIFCGIPLRTTNSLRIVAAEHHHNLLLKYHWHKNNKLPKFLKRKHKESSCLGCDVQRNGYRYSQKKVFLSQKCVPFISTLANQLRRNHPPATTHCWFSPHLAQYISSRNDLLQTWADKIFVAIG